MNKLIIIILVLVSSFSLKAQESNLQLVSSAGDSYQNENYQLDWSIGEIAVATFSGESQILTQGFHQGSLEISTLINQTDLEISMKIYPNPTSSYIHLTTEANKQRLKVYITNLNGTTIFSGDINAIPWQFDFSGYASGTYLLMVSKENRTLKSFKIVKHE